MSVLKILKGHNEGNEISLNGDRFALGRNPDCAIIIPITSVSREHAFILRVQGQYFLEDNKSRNGTFLNEQQITGRVPLKNNDQIRICDFIVAFQSKQSVDIAALDMDDDKGEDTSSTVHATINASSQQLLETQPAEKLRLLLEITSSLSKVLELDKLLPTTVDCMFQLFKQADRCFIIMGDTNTNKFIPRVIKTRRPQDETSARFSKSIVKQCLEQKQAFLSDDASQDSRMQTSQSIVDFKIRSVMCVPLCGVAGQAFGVIQVDTQDRSKKFTQDDLKLLWGVANQAGAAMENAKFHQSSLLQERIRRDLELANQVQKSFLPVGFPEIPGYDFAAHYQPAQEIGGDYYGFIPMSGNRMGVAVGDVAGKGIPAALLMAKLSSETRLALLMEPSPAEAITKLNDVLYPHTSQLDRFVTLILAVLNPDHKVTVVNAGHMAPIIVKGDGSPPYDSVSLDTAGVMLGILDGFPYEFAEFQLEPNQCMILYSDGVPDAMTVGDVPFVSKERNRDGLRDCLLGVTDTSAKNVLSCIVEAIKKHTVGRLYPHDDITIVTVHRKA